MADISRNPEDNAVLARLQAALEKADASVARTVRADATNLSKREQLLAEERSQQEVYLREISAAAEELRTAASFTERGAIEQQASRLASAQGYAGRAPATGARAESTLAASQRVQESTRAAEPITPIVNQGRLSEERAATVAARERTAVEAEKGDTLSKVAQRERDLQISSEGALSSAFITRVKEGNATFHELGNQVGITIAKFAGWTAAAGAVYGVIGLFAELKRGVVDAQSGVENLQRFIPNLNKGQAYASFQQISQQTNVPISDVATAEGQFARIFKNQTDVQTAARVAIVATKLDNVSLADSYRYLTALTQEYKLQASDLPGVFDKLASAQANAGGKVSELYAAIAKSAGVLRGAGVTDLNSIIALENTFQVRTGQTGNVIGTGFARGAANFFPSPKSQDLLKSFGIDSDNFGVALRQAIAKISSGVIPSSDAIAISKAFFGPLRGGLLTGGFRGQDQLSLSDAANAKAPGQAQRELDKRLQQADEQFKSIGLTIQRLGAQLAQSGVLESFLTLVHLITGFVTAAGSMVNVMSSLLGVFGGFGKEIPGLAIQVGILVALARKFNIGAGLLAGGGAAAAGTAVGAEEAGVAGVGLAGAFGRVTSGLGSLAGATVGLGLGIVGAIAAFALVKNAIDNANSDYKGRSEQIYNARNPNQVNTALRNQTGVSGDVSTAAGIANLKKIRDEIPSDVLGYGSSNIKALIDQAIQQGQFLQAYSKGYQNAINHYQESIQPIVQKFSDVKDPSQIGSLEAALANLKKQRWLQYFDPDAYNNAVAELQSDLDKLRQIGANKSGNPFLYGTQGQTQGTLDYFSQSLKTGSGNQGLAGLNRDNQAFSTGTFRQFAEGLFGSGVKGLQALATFQQEAQSNIKDQVSTQIQTLTSSTNDPNQLTSGYDKILKELESARANVGQNMVLLSGRLGNAQKKLGELNRQKAQQGDLSYLQARQRGEPYTEANNLSGEIKAQEQTVQQLKDALSKTGAANAQLILQYNLLVQQVKDAKFQEQTKHTTTLANISALNSSSQTQADSITIAADEKNVELALTTYGKTSQQYLDAVATATQARNQAAQTALNLIKLQGELSVSSITALGPAGDLQRAAAEVSAAQNNLSAAQGERTNPAKQADIINAQIALNNANRTYAQQQVQNARQEQQVAQQIADAHFDQQIAATTDPLKQATIQLSKAQSDLAAIRPGSYDTVQQYQAAYQDALTKVISAQTQLVQTRIQNLVDTAQYNEQAGNINEGQYLTKIGQIINQRGISTKQKQQLIVTARQGIIQNDLQQAQYEHDTQRISDQAYITQLQNILKLKGITTQQKRQLLTQIYQLQHANDGSLDLNVGNIQLPSIYQVRQAVLGGKVGQGNAIVNHTANVTVNVHKSADVSQVAAALDKSLGTSIRSAARAAGVV